MENKDSIVRIWEEEVVIPTYEIGEADKNPMFLDKRVYQGSSGKIYPYPMIETISDEKKDKVYKAVYLENKYIKVMILPELGGRIQRAYDKTNNYDFIYYNQVIKPALVGLTGPWISGGIEFNWPQHHRPTTFMPVDYVLQDNKDGSKTVFVNDVDQMYGTKGIAGFTLYPDIAYIEIRGQLYNRTPLPQTFLWWANPAVAVNDHTQSIFPPDVHAVMDHGKRDVSRFPIATGVYYKKDYSEGVDISRYKNIPVPTSYMAEKSEYDFVGGYDHNLQAGLLHVADYHIAPGKKQWTWGCGDFGKAWDRNLTDEDGPYIELMTGVYTDNQPDFTWLKPFEEKSFYQYFMPYKKVGAVKNATIYGAVNMTAGEKEVALCVYATGVYKEAVIKLYKENTVCFEEKMELSPEQVFEKTIPCEFIKETELKVVVSHGKKILVEYQPKEQKIEKLPEPAKAAKEPSQIMTNEELYLTGLHIEQYRHATYHPDDYYLEGLKRDSGDIRINTAYGELLLRRGHFKKAEGYFRKAIERLTWKNPNPYNSEAYYLLGLSLFYQGEEKDAFEAFYKASWSNEQQEMSFYFLAVLETRQKDYQQALAFIDKALSKNTRNIKARGLRAALLRKLSREEEALTYVDENLEIDRFDYISLHERILLSPADKKIEYEKALTAIMRGYYNNYLQAGRDYAEAGLYEEALQILSFCEEPFPLLFYYKGYYYGKLKQEDKERNNYKLAGQTSSLYCFPNKLEDLIVLTEAVKNNPQDAKGFYYLGNLYYDKRQFELAADLWEKAAEIDKTFPTVYRNLALAYFNKLNKKEKAREVMEKAFALDTTDARLFLELDQLYKKIGISPEDRLDKFKTYSDLYKQRDDLYLEYVTLHNQLKQHKEAYELIKERKFHPWEGGEGKVTTQYKIALLQLAKEELTKREYEGAREYLNKALVYPDNLGEGKLEGTKDNSIYYYLGVIEEALGNEFEAQKYFELAAAGDCEPAGMMYYNDQPADMILYQGLAFKKLGKSSEANARFYKLLDYGEQHLFDKIKVEYFAVSLPDFLIFDEDLNKRNQAHCNYLIGLAYLGMEEKEKSIEAFQKALFYDKNHMECLIYQEGGF